MYVLCRHPKSKYNQALNSDQTLAIKYLIQFIIHSTQIQLELIQYSKTFLIFNLTLMHVVVFIKEI